MSGGGAVAEPYNDNGNYSPTEDDYAEFFNWLKEHDLLNIERSEIHYDNEYFNPKYNIMNNYTRLASWHVVPTLENTSLRVFFMVFKPLNSNYSIDYDGIEYCRKYLSKCDTVIITREINSAKIHFNAIVSSPQDLTEHHEKRTGKFMIYCQEIKPERVRRVHEYIVKESRYRYFISAIAKKRPVDIYVRHKKIRYFNCLSVPIQFH